MDKFDTTAKILGGTTLVAGAVGVLSNSEEVQYRSAKIAILGLLGFIALTFFSAD